MGLLTTEKVPVDIGRPRLRLKLAAEELQDEEADEFPGRARSIVQTA